VTIRTTSRLASALGIGALAVVLCACNDVKSASDVGTAAEDFTATDVDGNTFHLSDHIGKQVVLIDFWATWCQPCLAEIPHLQTMYDKYKSRGLLVVAVSMDGPDSIADVPAFAKRNGMTFPVLLDEDSSIASIYNPRKSAPLSTIIDRSGRISAVREGYNPGDEAFVEKDVLKALGGGAPAATASAAPAATTAPPPATASASAAPAAPPPAK
jgi:peroxiredoxin